MVRSNHTAARHVMSHRGGAPKRRLASARPSTNTASSMETSPVHSMPGVGQTLRNVSDALSRASAHVRAIHRQGRRESDKLGVTVYENGGVHGLYRQVGPVSARDRALGVARSLLVYHGIPGRQRRIRRLYGQFVASGDLAFDI